MNTNQMDRWTGPPVKQVVWKAVLEFTNRRANVEFTNQDIKSICLRRYPNFKERNVEAQIISDCVNHPSRDHHYTKNVEYTESLKSAKSVKSASIRDSDDELRYVAFTTPLM